MSIELIPRLQAVHSASSEINHHFQALLTVKAFVAPVNKGAFKKVSSYANANNAVKGSIRDSEKFFELRFGSLVSIDGLHQLQWVRGDFIISKLYNLGGRFKPEYVKRMISRIQRTPELRDSFVDRLQDGFKYHSACSIERDGKILHCITLSKVGGLDSLILICFTDDGSCDKLKDPALMQLEKSLNYRRPIHESTALRSAELIAMC